MIMDVLHATGSKFATALGMADSETSDAVYITGMVASMVTAQPIPTSLLRCVSPRMHAGLGQTGLCGRIERARLPEHAYRGFNHSHQLPPDLSLTGPTVCAS